MFDLALAAELVLVRANVGQAVSAQSAGFATSKGAWCSSDD